MRRPCIQISAVGGIAAHQPEFRGNVMIQKVPPGGRDDLSVREVLARITTMSVMVKAFPSTPDLGMEQTRQVVP